MLYFTGKGVPHKLETAHEMFSTAAKGGNSSAYNNIGLCKERGYGTDIDTEGALDMYLQGAQLGSPHSMYSLGFLNIQQALHKKNSSEAESIKKQNKLSLETVKTTAEAISLIRHVTTAIDSDFAMNDIDGSKEKHMRTGVKWLRRAAEMSVAEAGYQLGLLYEQV